MKQQDPTTYARQMLDLELSDPLPEELADSLYRLEEFLEKVGGGSVSKQCVAQVVLRWEDEQ